MRSKNIYAALAFIVFGLWYGYLTSQLPERTLPDSPGISFFPWILTICLLVLSGGLLFQGLRSGSTAPSLDSFAKTLKRPAAGLALMAAYIAILPYLGFLIATPPLFGGLMWAVGERRLSWIIPFSVAIPFFLYFIFKNIFQVYLPTAAIWN